MGSSSESRRRIGENEGQVADTTWENGCSCDECASASRIYAYVGNDPLNATDPDGLFLNFVSAGIGAAIGLGFDVALNYSDYRSAISAGRYGEVLGRGAIAAGSGAVAGFTGQGVVAVGTRLLSGARAGGAGFGLELAAGAIGNSTGNAVQQGAQFRAGYRDDFSVGEIAGAAVTGAVGSYVAAGARAAGQAAAIEASPTARTALATINQLNGAALGAGFDLIRRSPPIGSRPSPDGGRS